MIWFAVIPDHRDPGTGALIAAIFGRQISCLHHQFIAIKDKRNPAIEIAELSPQKEFVSKDYRIDTIRGEFQIISEYLEQMKRLGVFDNSTIIILGDHGRPPLSSVVNKEVRITDSILTGLLIKQETAPRETLKTDLETFLSNRYIPATILECAGIDHSKFGVSIQDVIRGKLKIQRYFECYGFNGFFIAYSDWGSYRIDGPAADFTNWSYDGPAHN